MCEKVTLWTEKTFIGHVSPVHTVSLNEAKDRLEKTPAGSAGPVFLKDAGKQKIYSESIWQEMHQVFRRVLRATDVLVISGYGFDDSGINEAIFSWLCQEEDRTVVILHKKGNKMTDNCFRFLVRGRKIRFIKKWFCNATLDDILKTVDEA